MKSIIELAKQAGFKDPVPADGYMGLAYDYRSGTDSGGSLERFAALVRAAALEEAAGVCDEQAHDWHLHAKGGPVAAYNAWAAAIRALKTGEKP